MPDEEHVDSNCDMNTSMWMLSTFNKAEGVSWVMGGRKKEKGNDQF